MQKPGVGKRKVVQSRASYLAQVAGSDSGSGASGVSGTDRFKPQPQRKRGSSKRRRLVFVAFRLRQHGDRQLVELALTGLSYRLLRPDQITLVEHDLPGECYFRVSAQSQIGLSPHRCIQQVHQQDRTEFGSQALRRVQMLLLRSKRLQRPLMLAGGTAVSMLCQIHAACRRRGPIQHPVHGHCHHAKIENDRCRCHSTLIHTGHGKRACQAWWWQPGVMLEETRNILCIAMPEPLQKLLVVGVARCQRAACEACRPVGSRAPLGAVIGGWRPTAGIEVGRFAGPEGAWQSQITGEPVQPEQVILAWVAHVQPSGIAACNRRRLYLWRLTATASGDRPQRQAQRKHPSQHMAASPGWE
ncbi:hypothetical protein [Denitratimonas sp. CY0512]|uniref:hypothetical protein n=1 Tax=Denitratimonas sp. CY0512 TaxID=3131940 RepID=UPI0030D7A1E8